MASSSTFLIWQVRAAIDLRAAGGGAVTREALVELLGSANSAINQPDAEGNMPIHVAASRGLSGVASLLVRFGADITVHVWSMNSLSHSSGTRPRVAVSLSSAISRQSPCNLQALNSGGETPAQIAGASGHFELRDKLTAGRRASRNNC